MLLLFCICLFIIKTACADTNAIKNEHYVANNWERYDGNKPPNILKLPARMFLSTPYNLNIERWSTVLRLINNQSGREWITENIIIGSNEPQYRTVQLRSSGVPLNKWLFTPNIDIEKAKNSQLERRNPSFSLWGGKRSMNLYKTDPKIRRPSRVPFNSWGGKRDRENDVFDEINNNDKIIKRFSATNLPGVKKPFNSWGGKRALVIKYFVQVLSNDVLRNIWKSTHSPVASLSIHQHAKHDTVADNNKNNDLEENKGRITFEPRSGKKINVNSNEDDGVISPATTLRYTK